MATRQSIRRAARPESIIVAAAVILAVPGEWHVARAIGWSAWVAWLMPANLSLAAGLAHHHAHTTRTRRAYTAAWLAYLMAFAAQSAAHLIAVHMLPVTPAVVIAISAVPFAASLHILHNIRTAPAAAPTVAPTAAPRRRTKPATPAPAPAPPRPTLALAGDGLAERIRALRDANPRAGRNSIARELGITPHAVRRVLEAG